MNDKHIKNRQKSTSSVSVEAAGSVACNTRCLEDFLSYLCLSSQSLLDMIISFNDVIWATISALVEATSALVEEISALVATSEAATSALTVAATSALTAARTSALTAATYALTASFNSWAIDLNCSTIS